MASAASDGFRADFDRLRGIAILLVVVSHTLALSKDTELGQALYTATRGATWMFVFIAGFLFAHLRERYSYTSYLVGKLHNVIAPYAIIVSLIVILGLARVAPRSSLDFWQYYALGHTAASPLWFIPMIILIYLGFPIYRYLCRSPPVLTAATGCAVLYAALSPRPFFDAGPFANLLFFQSAFLFGLFWRIHQETCERLVREYYPFIVMALAVGILIGKGPSAVFARGQMFAILPMTVLLLSAMRFDSPLNRVWEWFSSRSFGIFFLHGPVTNQLSNHLGREHNALLVLLGGLALIFLCGIVVSAIRQFAGNRSRLLVGA